MTESSKERFGRYADGYVTSKGHAEGDELDRLVEIAAPEKDWRVLDVATGAGHTALKFAPHVSHVVALDITPQMLEKARQLASERGLTNVSTKEAPAERLPFESACFNLVTCRIAPHHFEDCSRFVAEAARVLARGGLLLVQDHVVPEESQAQAEVEDFERLRDPSHNRAYTQAEWRQMLSAAGFEVFREEIVLKRHVFVPWAERQGCAADVIAQLEGLMDRASVETRAWMDPQRWHTPEASFLNRHLIIAGRSK